MRIAVAAFVVVIACSSICTSGIEREFLSHQYYPGDVAQAHKAIKLVLNDTKIGVIGADDAAGVIVSRPYSISEAEPDLVDQLDKGQPRHAVLVISIASTTPGVVEVDIATLLHATTGKRGLVRSHGWVGGNTLTQRVYSGLERHLGEGHLKPLGS